MEEKYDYDCAYPSHCDMVTNFLLFSVPIVDTVLSKGERENWKLNNRGEYVRFYGVTFICPLPGFRGGTQLVKDPSMDVWAQVLDMLFTDFHVRAHYAPLPRDSLHVTIKNHETARGMRMSDDGWLERVILDISNGSQSTLRAMFAECQRAAYRPFVSISSSGRGWSAIDSTLQVRVDLSPTPEPLRDALVALGSRPEPNFVFHITLA
jgi:hypothetical protein